MIIRALVRFFPERESEVQLFNVDTRNYNIFYEEQGAIELVRDYLNQVKGSYPDLEIEMIEQAAEVDVAPFVAKLQ